MELELDDVRSLACNAIQNGAMDRRSAMHTPVVTTADADARVMVVRAFDCVSMTLRFHTDRRAPKAALIGAGAPVGVLFYDREARVQIRAMGTGRIEADTSAADRAWEESTNFARRCYLGAAPGSPSPVATSGLPAKFEGVQPTDEQVIPARVNFAILLVSLHSLDWFHLAHTGHRRAQFELQGADWTGRWVAP